MDVKFSVVTATHNRAADFLPKCIESVLAQTHEDFEYIIVDDASNDDTASVVLEYARKDKRIKLIQRENNHGTGTAPKNDGIKAAKNEWIAYIDDDVEWYPYHLQTLASSIKNNPDIDFFYTDLMLVDTAGNMQPGIAMEFDPQFLLRRNYIDTSVACHRKSLAYAVGGWDETVKRFTDWNLWVRMSKWGANFLRIPIITITYTIHEDTQSSRTKVDTWFDRATGMTMFKPQFDPTGDYIFRPYLGENEKETNPKIAIFTLTYDRLDYTKRMWESLKASTQLDFRWFVVDQGSTDGTVEWLTDLELEDTRVYVKYLDENVGISKGSNMAIDAIGDNTQIIVKVDNDCEFVVKDSLETLVDLWKRNHMLYSSPYPEGLVHHPGGAPRVGNAYIGPYPVEVTKHIGGLCAFIDARAYDDFRWQDQFKHGYQDAEASQAFMKQGYMPCYVPTRRVMHMDTTEGQYKKYKGYFDRRVKEKTEVA